MTHPTDALRLVPSKITPEMAQALESNFAECIPPSPIHAENWQEAWSKCLAAAPASPLPEGAGQCSGISGQLSARRVDLEKGSLADGGDLDDLAIAGDLIEMVRVERMSDNSCWGMIYMKDGQHIRLSWSSSKGKLAVTAETDA